MINRFYTTTFTVKRMVWYEESGELQDLMTFYGHIQQATMEMVQSLGLSMTKTFTLWCANDIGLKVGDQIASGGKYYSVKALNIRDYAGINKHIEAIIELTETFE